MVPKWTNINDQLNTGKTQKMLILTSEKVTVVRNEIALNAKATIVSLRPQNREGVTMKRHRGCLQDTAWKRRVLPFIRFS